jgi:hypothetical protein
MPNSNGPRLATQTLGYLAKKRSKPKRLAPL